MYCDILLCSEVPATYPFAGFVVNLCVCTDGHRDSQDAEDMCVVMQFSRNCKGGGLCLYEAGLVFEMESGDILIFPSRLLTHFNLHFDGIRASLVLHTDKHCKDWIADRNGWAGEGEFGIIT